jgi:hypothetical protein
MVIDEDDCNELVDLNSFAVALDATRKQGNGWLTWAEQKDE